MHELTGLYYIGRGDHYFMERVALQSAAERVLFATLLGEKEMGEAITNLRAVVDALELFSEVQQREEAKAPAPTKLHMLACGKFGPAFQARMEGVV